MARYNPHHNSAPVLAAGRVWLERAWVNDSSVLTDRALWTPKNCDELVERFVNAPETSKTSFYEKLERQLAKASPEARMLMAEMLWILMLFQSSMQPETKREAVQRIWAPSGVQFPNSPFLRDEVLGGLGHPGVAFNTGRPRELKFLINATVAFKKLTPVDRSALANDAWEFARWLGTVPEQGHRQLPYMLTHLAFPDTFERIAVTHDKQEILSCFEGKPLNYYRGLADDELDRDLLALRERLVEQHGSDQVDFYEEPLRARWKDKKEEEGAKGRAWLLTWNPSRWPWTDLPKDLARAASGESVRDRWSCANTNPRIGDKVWLVRLGAEPRVVMARGKVLKESYEATHWDADRARSGEMASSIDIEFDEIRDPSGPGAVPVSALDVEEAKGQQWTPQASGIEINQQADELLRDLWDQFHPKIGKDTPTSVSGDPINLILYGPPGTGKTYRIDRLRAEYTDRPQEVARQTWMQELVAKFGWRPAIVVALASFAEVTAVRDLVTHPLLIAKAAQRGRKENVQTSVYNYLREHCAKGAETLTAGARREPLVFERDSDGCWATLAAWKEIDPEAADLHTQWNAGPAASPESIKRYRFVTFHPSYSYEDFIRGIRPVDDSEGGVIQFRTVDGVFKQVCEEARANPTKRYAIFIDEINRANIAKVFGELITLIEPNKRARYDSEGRCIEGLEVTLPGGGEADSQERPFGVPRNVDIYGTMNTADRSIALLDIALRRRFIFEEMEPLYNLLPSAVEGVDLAALLKQVNDRLEYLIDRDHRIGHAYLMGVTGLDGLRRAFARQILPLLQEYFFDDLHRVAMVLSKANGTTEFLRREHLVHSTLFPGTTSTSESDRFRYVVTPQSSWSADSFKGIYETRNVLTEPPGNVG